jgi:DNA-binding HxlR family transcriptional regulator
MARVQGGAAVERVSETEGSEIGAAQMHAREACPPGERFCGVAAASQLLGDAWTLLLVRDLADGPRRFTALQASTGISPRVLTDRLRTLVERGLMTRRMYPEIPPRVEYELTEMGRDALPVIAALRAYGTKWLSETAAAECPTNSVPAAS